jgi:Ni,Fe-hydrogenase III small subunit/ferredoxin
MLEWIVRGLSQGRITTRYPRRPEPAPPGFHGSVEVIEPADPPSGIAEVCPTGAIATTGSRWLTLDRGRCILCGECVRAAPERFAFRECYETAARARAALVVDDHASTDMPSARRTLGEQARMLRRSIHIRHIDCGSDGAEEWEIQALWNPYYDIQRLGFFLTAAPRHADILLVTGGVTGPMRAPLERTWDVMPEPKALVAVGTDACSGGLARDSGLVAGGVDQVLSVDVYVPGSPPAPIAIMHALLLATGLLIPTEAAA